MNDHVGNQGRCSDAEDLRDDLNRVITNYPSLTVVETIGMLELVKAEWVERLRTSGPATDK